MLNPCAELFATLLKDKNLNFRTGTTDSGASVVEFPYNGKITKMFFGGENGEYLSMYLVYENVPEEKVADVIFACNDLNTEYKWVTFYVDKDNDIILHDDAILSTENAAEEAFELLIRMTQLAEKAKQPLMHAIYA